MMNSPGAWSREGESMFFLFLLEWWDALDHLLRSAINRPDPAIAPLGQTTKNDQLPDESIDDQRREREYG
jgi:hypothetical protein